MGISLLSVTVLYFLMLNFGYRGRNIDYTKNPCFS
jgi:hypothetical protein